MYVIYCLLLWVFVYSLPALALFPRLVLSPRTAFAIPILSVFVIYTFTSFTIFFGLLTTVVATTFSLLMALIAVFRLRGVVLGKSFDWSRQDAFFYIFHIILLFPYFIKLGTHAFERGDEIYSWNFWAIQHYFLEPIDFSHTGAPYPQLFPKLLAFCYHLVGNLELQLPVRATLIIFPWAMLTAIAMAYRYRLAAHVGAYLALLVYVLIFVGLEQFFNDGYADPVMTSCLIVSVVLYWQSQQRLLFSSQSFSTLHFTPPYFALLSVLCGITAAHTKQPALLWALFSLPVLLWFSAKGEVRSRFRWLAGLSLLGGLCWLIGEGWQFHQNHGVIWLSIADRNAWSQLLFSVNKYFVHRPLLFLLFLFAFLASRHEKTLRRMVHIFMLPSIILWFFFGAYHLRLGQHLIAFAFFVIVASGYALPEKLTQWKGWQRFAIARPLQKRHILFGSVGVSLCLSALLFVQGVWLEKPGISLYDGGRHSLQRYFGKDADQIYAMLYKDPEALLWVPSRYLYGLFYKHTLLTTPDYAHYDKYDKAALINELQRKLPDYVFTVSQDIIDGPASGLLAEVISECPQAFTEISSAQNRFSFITYKVNKAVLINEACLVKIASSS